MSSYSAVPILQYTPEDDLGMYVPDPIELEDHVPVYIPKPEHHEDLVPAEDEAPIPPLPDAYLLIPT
ncbi:hypothetical protein Tco_0507832 [Tanacetum coccineum]